MLVSDDYDRMGQHIRVRSLIRAIINLRLCKPKRKAVCLDHDIRRIGRAYSVPHSTACIRGLSLLIYGFTILLLIAVIFLGIEVKGSRSWFAFGPVRLQPAEISKISTSLMLATVMSQLGYRIGRMRDFITTALIILVPMMIIVLQSETGSALVYVGFIFMLYMICCLMTEF